MEETTLPLATMESNPKTELETLDGTISITQQQKRKEGCKDLTKSKNSAQARKMVALLKATYF